VDGRPKFHCAAGNGSWGWRTAIPFRTLKLPQELIERLADVGVTSTEQRELDRVLVRLEDVGQVVRAQRQGHPVQIVLAGSHPFDRIDALAADICATIKDHGESFESDDDLREWLDEDLISCSPEDLDAAIQHLEWIGRLKRPRQDQWDEDRPLPGIYVPPRIHNE
jgi:GAF domain-containing protein